MRPSNSRDFGPYDETVTLDLRVHLRHTPPPDDHPVFGKNQVKIYVTPTITTTLCRSLRTT